MGVMRTLRINGVTYNVVPLVPADRVTLVASAWLDEGERYSQVVAIPGVTASTKVDLQPTADQLAEFHYKVLGFTTENDGGLVTVYAIGDKPKNNHTIQVTLTEVEGSGKIRGNTVGTTTPRSDLSQDDPSKADYVRGRETFVRTINGIAPDENGNVEITIPEGGGTGLSNDEKTLILSLFGNTAFNDVDMSATLNQLKNLFNGGEPNTYSVTYNLTDVTSDNTAETAKEAFPFTATLSVADGLLIREDNLSVTMGGEDITDSVYADGVITIPCVTGGIVITAQSKDATLLYVLPEETVFDGTTPYIDTGISLVDEHKSFSILFEFSSTQNQWQSVFSDGVDGSTYEPFKSAYSFSQVSGWNWRAGFMNTLAGVVKGGAATNLKVVLTYDHSTKTHSQYYISADALTVETATCDFSKIVGTTSGLRLGTGKTHDSIGFKGTIHSFEVHAKVVDEATIKDFMGVA